ncbi:MAG TPA: CBS domain-containing protein [Bacteroidales bacterium]|nr:CBS domain-containing protein [Bacteroidales bacterium]HPT01311.1 CBS domain-containing protein [Bacteroidales bacterium]
MIAKDLFTDAVIPLKTSDTGLTALHWMDEFKVEHMPIVNDSEFLGLISEDDIFAFNSFEEPLGNHPLSHQNAYVNQSQHIYDVIRMFSDLKLTLLPVVDDKRKYLGVITLAPLVEKMAAIAAINDPGGIIVLELTANDYSISEIAQIIESNDARVLSLYVTSHSDSTKLELTIKVNRQDIQPILQTFQRYDYLIKASFFESDYYDSLRDRYDQLMNFLNI